MQLGIENYNGFSAAYVVFEDNTSLWWLRILKPGFRHCYMLFVCTEHDAILKLNPMSNQLSIEYITSFDCVKVIHNLKNDKNKKICQVKISSAPLKCAPVMVFTCVEFVKRVLGIHDYKTITPYQLYKKIKRCRKNILTL